MAMSVMGVLCTCCVFPFNWKVWVCLYVTGRFVEMFFFFTNSVPGFQFSFQPFVNFQAFFSPQLHF